MNRTAEVRNIYLISGLGADWRLFRNLDFPANTVAIHVEWIKPGKNEPLKNYAQRLSEKIDTSKPFYLIGLSFGGMVAIEMLNFIQPLRTIIISSAATSDEVPVYYKIAGKLYLPAIVPMALLKITHPLTFWYFGVKTKDEKALLKQVLNDMDSHFMRWALQQITIWKNNIRPKNILHIHGTADKVLPVFFCKPDIKIAGGEHLMIYIIPDKINKIIADEISKL